MMPARRPAGTTAGPITYSARMRRGVTATLLSIAVVVAWQAGATPARAEPVQAVSDTYSTFVDKTLVVPAPGVLENDGITSLAGLTIAVYSAPNIGTLKFPGNGSFTYVPVPGYVGTQKFVYSVTETNGAISLASVAIDVIDNRPTANPDDYAVGQGLYLNVMAPGLMANDTDPGGKTLTVASVTQPSHGTVVAAANGAFTYLSDPSFAGIDSFDYDISNGVASTGSNVRIVVSGSGAAGDVGSTKATTAVSGGVPGSASSLPSVDGRALVLGRLDHWAGSRGDGAREADRCSLVDGRRHRQERGACSHHGQDLSLEPRGQGRHCEVGECPQGLDLQEGEADVDLRHEEGACAGGQGRPDLHREDDQGSKAHPSTHGDNGGRHGREEQHRARQGSREGLSIPPP
jgi:hypothetical protein